jgi:nucleoside triphosphatase
VSFYVSPTAGKDNNLYLLFPRVIIKKSNMKTRIVVSAIIEKDKKILLGRKGPGVGPYPDAWQMPGGGANIEEESLEEAVKREIKEEAGIEIYDIKKVAFDEDYAKNKDNEMVHYVFLQFHVFTKDIKVTPGDDIAHLEWVEKDKLKEYNLCLPTKKLFKKIGLI